VYVTNWGPGLSTALLSRSALKHTTAHSATPHLPHTRTRSLSNSPQERHKSQFNLLKIPTCCGHIGNVCVRVLVWGWVGVEARACRATWRIASPVLGPPSRLPARQQLSLFGPSPVLFQLSLQLFQLSLQQLSLFGPSPRDPPALLYRQALRVPALSRRSGCDLRRSNFLLRYWYQATRQKRQ
jgi:hypothetical protein